MAINIEGKTEKDKIKMAAKLHLQFGHPSHKRLLQLVTSAGIKDESFIRIMENHAGKCETCIRYKKKNPRPVVGMSLSKEFNSTIAMDLKMYKQNIILHIIDLATRYIYATVIKDKRKETVVELYSSKHTLTALGWRSHELRSVE